MPTVDVQQLESIITTVFERLGVASSAATQISQHLVEANLFGHDSHGLLRVAQYCQAIEDGEVDPVGSPKVIRESTAGAVIDGARAFGQVAARFAMNIAIEKAARGGIAAVTV